MDSDDRSGDSDDGEWAQVWQAREAALTQLLGEPSDIVFHATIPFELREAGGSADVVPFPNFVEGVTYVTCELTGQDVGQQPSSLGHYELMICVRSELPAAADFISRLACYTCDAVVEPGETMDIDDFFEDGTLRALLFAHPLAPDTRFEFGGERYGLLLCIGITAPELEFAKVQGRESLLALLKEHGAFPYTVPDRPSVPLPAAKAKRRFWPF